MAESLLNTEGQDSEESVQGDGRPDWLPEQYWDDGKGEANVKSLVKSLTDFQTQARNRKEQMRQEIEAELAEGLPPSPEGYELDSSAWELPDGMRFDGESDPLMEKVRHWAHENKVPQEAFNKLVGTYVKTIAGSRVDRQAELQKLGEKAEERLRSIENYVTKVLNDDELQVFANMSYTADQVLVLEKLLDARKQGGPQSFDTDGPSVNTLEAELERLMSSPEYYTNVRNPALDNRVNELQKQLFLRKQRRSA
jgi:hypothetical protein